MFSFEGCERVDIVGKINFWLFMELYFLFLGKLKFKKNVKDFGIWCSMLKLICLLFCDCKKEIGIYVMFLLFGKFLNG